VGVRQLQISVRGRLLFSAIAYRLYSAQHFSLCLCDICANPFSKGTCKASADISLLWQLASLDEAAQNGKCLVIEVLDDQPSIFESGHGVGGWWVSADEKSHIEQANQFDFQSFGVGAESTGAVPWGNYGNLCGNLSGGETIDSLRAYSDSQEISCAGFSNQWQGYSDWASMQCQLQTSPAMLAANPENCSQAQSESQKPCARANDAQASWAEASWQALAPSRAPVSAEVRAGDGEAREAEPPRQDWVGGTVAARAPRMSRGQRGAHVRGRPDMSRTARDGAVHWARMLAQVRQAWDEVAAGRDGFVVAYGEHADTAAGRVRAKLECLLRTLQLAAADGLVHQLAAAPGAPGFFGWAGFRVEAGCGTAVRGAVEALLPPGVPGRREEALREVFRRAGLVPARWRWSEAWAGRIDFVLLERAGSATKKPE